MKSIPLRQWVDGALNAVDISAPAGLSSASSSDPLSDPESWPADIRRSVALSSSTYLTLALKVARSLAEQLCNTEDDDGRCQPQPSPGPDWADLISIRLSSVHRNNVDSYEGELLQPLPYSPEKASSDPRDLQAMLNSLIQDESLFTKEDEKGEEETDAKIFLYDNVVGVDFTTGPDGEEGFPRNEMKQLYSLGLVFYELFGGERPAGSTHQLNDGYQRSVDEKKEDASGDNSAYFDLGGKLNLFDNVFDDTDDLLDDQAILEQPEESAPRKKKGPQASSDNGTTRSSIVEPLLMKGLPASLCNMIGNMVDCINGDLSGDEAYRTMPDVLHDLQLMLDKPNRFLYDMDVDRLAVTGLQLDEVAIGREVEFSALKESYRRSISGETELAVIKAPSGMGKSVLANRLGRSVTASGGLFLTGKFDRLRQATPFSALALAFNEYCNMMTKNGRSRQLQEVASKLRLVLGVEARHLVKVIPNLSIILGQAADQQDEEEDCVDAQKRLQYLLCQFVGVISTLSGAPIVLFLDDLQWADQASINAIKKLLLLPPGSFSGKRQFFFLGSTREEGMHEGHQFGKMVSDLSQLGVKTTVVELSCMGGEMTNAVLSDLLCLSPRLTRSLSEIIHHKTKGNPLFFAQLMRSLHKDGLLRLSLSRRRWEWDEERIQSRKLPDDVASFLSAAIERLPKDVKRALFTLSCFGTRSECSVIEILEKRIGEPLISPLEVAVAEGLVDKLNGSYSFGHDKLQEAAYKAVQPDDLCLLHFKYGVSLVPRALELHDDNLLFIAAEQINHGGPASIEDAEQAVLIANLNLTAGNKAMGMSDFSSAFSYFDNGISFLRKRHWQEHYDLSLKLFDAASKCALLVGDIVSLKLLSEQILTFAKSLEDKLNATYYVVTALAYTSQMKESVSRSILILSDLGEQLPDSFSELELVQHIEQTRIMLHAFTDKELIEYRSMQDQKKIMAMKFLARLLLFFQMIKPAMQPVVALKMVQLSIAQGMSVMTPISLTYFGQILAWLGNIQDGCRYVRLARKMLDRHGSKEAAGEVYAIGTTVLCFEEPLQTNVESHVEGFNMAMAAGDSHGAMANSTFYLPTSFWAGINLSIVKERYENGNRVMKEQGQLTWLAFSVQMEKNILRLMGTAGSELDCAETHDIRTSNPQAAYTFYFQHLYISFMFREFKLVLQMAEKFFEYDKQRWILIYTHSAQSFIGGLCAFWIHRQTKDSIWAERGRKAKRATAKWAESSQHNFQHKLYLLEAEEAFSFMDVETAKSAYQNAIASAKKHHFINDEALASELAGYFFLEIGEKSSALQYFLRAHERYHEWGAIAKSNALFEFVQKALGSTSTTPDFVICNSSCVDDHGDGDNKNRRKRVSNQ